MKHNARKLRLQNKYLRKKLQLESKLAKYRMRLIRSSKKVEKARQITEKIKRKKMEETKEAVQDFLLQD